MRYFVGELLGSNDLVPESQWKRYKRTTGRWPEYVCDHGPFESLEFAKAFVKDKFRNDYMWDGGDLRE